MDTSSPEPSPSKNTLSPGKILFRVLWCLLILLFIGESVSIGLSIHSRVGIRYRMDKQVDLHYSQYLNNASHNTIAPSLPKVRNVAEILEDSDYQGIASINEKKDNGAPAPPPLPSISHNITYSDPEKLSTGDDLLDRLIREARAAQIEGDMRKATLKLEEALSHHKNHPAALYHLGITYEMLQNTTKAREYYLQVFQQRESAGLYYAEASKKLQMGFDLAEDMRGKISFGPIRAFKTTNDAGGETIHLTIPVRVAPGASISPKELYIPIQFYDLINDREIIRTRAETSTDSPKNAWLNETAEWSDGERVLEVKYVSSASSEEILAYGDIRYYGYTAKLYYKGEPMDCKSTPNSLILVEYKKQPAEEFFDPNESLLPPLETIPASEGLVPNNNTGEFLPDDSDSLLPLSS